TATPVRDYRDMQTGDARLAGIFNEAVREQGVLKPAAKLYPHLALSEADLRETEAAFIYAAEQVAAAITAA
ncbi:MAG: aspartate aminotransferase family protein, partial [Pseudomonadota bacterium]|nr:aspartate aminotransferase family protein [Pseudomonadota bacterium]